MLTIVTDQPPKKKRVQSKMKTRGFEPYLGKSADKERRLEALKALAGEHGIATVSELLQLIADGDLKIVDSSPRSD